MIEPMTPLVYYRRARQHCVEDLKFKQEIWFGKMEADEMTTESNIDLASDEAIRNPYPVYRHMRAACPFHHTQNAEGDPVTLVTRHDDIVKILKDDARFTVDMTQIYPPEMVAQFLEMDHVRVLQLSMLGMDGPDHHRLRALVQKAFTPRRVEALRPRIQAIADALLDNMAREDRAELMQQYAFPLPVTVIAELLGVPATDQNTFHRWADEVMTLTSFEAMLGAKPLVDEFSDYFRALYAERRARPQDDLISALVAAEDNGSQLTEVELISMTILILIAGYETTLNLIGNSIHALLSHPDQMALLMQQPDLIGNAVEEFLRYNTPVQTPSPRFALEDVKIAGATLSQGEQVVVMLSSANHDEELVANPEKFDITRAPSRHMGFGLGVHYCLGAPLARLEVEVAVLSLLRRFPSLRYDGNVFNPDWKKQDGFRALATLPVLLD